MIQHHGRQQQGKKHRACRTFQCTAEHAAQNTKGKEQWGEPCSQPSRRLLQTGNHREIGKQHAGEQDGELQRRAQDRIHSFASFSNRNFINVCRADLLRSRLTETRLPSSS